METDNKNSMGETVLRRGKTGIFRRLLAAAALSACTLTAIPALAELKGLEIIAPANSGGATTSMPGPSSRSCRN
jgi:hypothetical protein